MVPAASDYVDVNSSGAAIKFGLWLKGIEGRMYGDYIVLSTVLTGRKVYYLDHAKGPRIVRRRCSRSRGGV